MEKNKIISADDVVIYLVYPTNFFTKLADFRTVSCWILILKYFDITKKVDLIIHTLYCENIIQNIRKYTELTHQILVTE